MNRIQLFAIPIVLLAIAMPLIAAPKTIRTEKGGKVVLTIDDGKIRKDPAGSPVLTISDAKVMTADGKPLFFVFGDIAHAYEPDGTVVGYIDGRQLRTAPGGKETIYIDAAIVRQPNRAGDPVLWIDNNEVLDNMELFGALYVLKPEIFSLPKANTSMLPKAEPAASPQSNGPAPAAIVPAAAGKAFIGGTYTLSDFQKSAGASVGGAVTIRPVGDIFLIDFKLADNTTLQGVAVLHDRMLIAAIGEPNTIGLAFYQPDGSALAGTWFNATGDASKYGSETLSDPKAVVGAHTITAAKAPFTGAAYAGTVTVEATSERILEGKACAVHWDLSGYKIEGCGIATATTLAAASTTGKVCMIARIPVDGASLKGEAFNTQRFKTPLVLKRTGD